MIQKLVDKIILYFYNINKDNFCCFRRWKAKTSILRKGGIIFRVIWFIIVGFLAGLIARAILPGADHMGFLMTTAVGIGGSIIGGLIGDQIKKPEPGAKFHMSGFLMSILGAVVLLLLVRLIH